jgi:adenine deaminase
MSKVAITNVRVFDGYQILEPTTVIIDGPVIGGDDSGAEIIDSQDSILLPGLIDCHIHPQGSHNLQELAQFGVTTGLDMATWPASLLKSLRNSKGVTDIRSPGPIACAPGDDAQPHGNLPC